MKNLITSVLITISCVVTAQNVKVKSSEPNYTVGVRNGTHIKINTSIKSKNKVSHDKKTSSGLSYIIERRNGKDTITLKETNKNMRARYKNVYIGYPAVKQVKNKKVVKHKKAVTVEEAQVQKLDTIPALLIGIDTSEFNEGMPYVMWTKGFEVVEQHNTSENSIDPGIMMCIDNKGNTVSCHYDYFTHLKYLDSNKKPFIKKIIIIQKIK